MDQHTVKDIHRLQREIFLLRSAVISILGEDDEGVYRPEFVEEILRASVETPRYRFRSAKAFLADLGRA